MLHTQTAAFLYNNSIGKSKWEESARKFKENQKEKRAVNASHKQAYDSFKSWSLFSFLGTHALHCKVDGYYDIDI